MKLIVGMSCVFILLSCSLQKNVSYIYWQLPKLINSKNREVTKVGCPQNVNDDVVASVSFDGIDDGIFIDTMPLKGLSSFTVEAVFFPQKEGSFEQRFLHIGEVRGDRILLEIRANADCWYFDSYICAGGNKIALIDSLQTHPFDRWYHVAFVVDAGKLASYVNGNKELSGSVEITPLMTGKTSIGMRLNKVSWFKGKIAAIKISPKAIEPEKFKILNQ